MALSYRLSQMRFDHLFRPAGFGDQLRQTQALMLSACDSGSQNRLSIAGIHDLQEGFLRGLPGKRRGIQHDSTADRHQGGKLADDETIAREQQR